MATISTVTIGDVTTKGVEAMQAQRTYRPDTVSVSGYDVNATQDTLWKWWSYGDAVQFEVSASDLLQLRVEFS